MEAQHPGCSGSQAAYEMHCKSDSFSYFSLLFQLELYTAVGRMEKIAYVNLKFNFKIIKRE